MRFLLLPVLIALLISPSLAGKALTPSAQAAEVVKYKERRPQPQTQETQSRSKRPPQPPPPPPQPRHDPPPQWPEPWCPPPRYISVPLPGPDLTPLPIAVELHDVLARRLRVMEMEGFEGQVAVGWDGEVYFERVYGDLYQPETRGYYDIAAVTKAFTAWAIYVLVDSEKLALGTTLGELFPDAPADKCPITIEQLLGNTSGLGNTYAADGETDRDTAVSKLLAEPLAHAPGAEFTYSDDGYVLLAAAIEVASGMAYESYMMESDVVSADMKQTAFWGEVGSQGENWGQRGSGGILSTAHDLHKWASRFFDGPELMVEEITRPRVLTETGEGVGYGWFWSDPDSDAPTLWTSGTGYLDHNVTVVMHPSNAILVVTSDRFHGDVPWSERVANALEPFLLRAEAPPRWRLHTTMRTTGNQPDSPVD